MHVVTGLAAIERHLGARPPKRAASHAMDARAAARRGMLWERAAPRALRACRAAQKREVVPSAAITPVPSGAPNDQFGPRPTHA